MTDQRGRLYRIKCVHYESVAENGGKSVLLTCIEGKQ